MEKLARIDPDMAQQADDGQALIDERPGAHLAGLRRRPGVQPQRLAEVEERLELIASLKRKYGDTIVDINAFGEKVRP